MRRLLRWLGVRSRLHFDGSVRREMEAALQQGEPIKPPRVRYQGDKDRHRIRIKKIEQWRKRWAS